MALLKNLALTIALLLSFSAVGFAASSFNFNMKFSSTGWNLVSIPGITALSSPYSIRDTFCSPDTTTSQQGSCSKVYFYNATEKKWYNWDSSLSDSQNTLTQIISGYSYWVYVDSIGYTKPNSILDYGSSDTIANEPRYGKITNGWNMFGWSSTDPLISDSVLLIEGNWSGSGIQSAKGNWDKIVAVWNISTTGDLIQPYWPSNANAVFKQFRGYWVCVNNTTNKDICDTTLPPLMPWQNQRPELSNAVAIGDANNDTDTAFTFSVTYKDVDNDIPSKTVVNIDGTDYVMTAGGSSYATGVAYTLAKKFTAAKDYSYFFNFSDGNGHYVKIPWKDGTTGTITVKTPEPVIFTPSQWLADSRTMYDGSKYDVYYASLKAIGIVTKNVKWEFKFRDSQSIGGAPAVYNGVVYVGTPAGKLYALDAKTGAQKWVYDIGINNNGNILSTPLIRTDGIYFQSYKGLYALNLDGTLKWVRSDLQGDKIAASNTDRIFIATSTDKKIGFYAVSVADGSTLWAKYDSTTFKDADGTPFTAYREWSAPTIFSNNIYTIRYGNLTSYTESGSLRWTNGSVGKRNGYVDSGKKDANGYVIMEQSIVDIPLGFSQVSVVNDIYAIGREDYGSTYLYSFDSTGKPKWRSAAFTETWRAENGKDYPVAPSAPTISSGAAYVTVGSSLYSFKISDGTLNWKKSIANGLSSVIVANGNILVKDGTGKLLILDSSGNTIWSVMAGGGMPVVCDTSCYGAPGFMATASIGTTSITPMSVETSTPVTKPAAATPITANVIKAVQPAATKTDVVKQVTATVKPVADAATQRANQIRNAFWERKARSLQ